MMIRKMNSNDYEAVKKLVYQVHALHYTNRADIYIDGNPLPFEYFSKMIDDPSALNYVYEEDNNIVALLMASKQRKQSTPILKRRVTYFIEDIVVDHKYRRKGIGKKIYDFLLEEAKSQKVDAIELNVWAFNESAIRFYESLGMSVKNMKLEQSLNHNDAEVKKLNFTITSKVNDECEDSSQIK